MFLIVDVEDPSESTGPGYQKVGQMDLSDGTQYQQEDELESGSDDDNNSDICSDSDSYISDSECGKLKEIYIA